MDSDSSFYAKNFRISEERLQQSICCIFIFWLKEILTHLFKFPAWSEKATTIYMRSAAVAQTNTAVAGTESFRSVPHQQEVLSIFAFLFLESTKEWKELMCPSQSDWNTKKNMYKIRMMGIIKSWWTDKRIKIIIVSHTKLMGKKRSGNKKM